MGQPEESAGGLGEHADTCQVYLPALPGAPLPTDLESLFMSLALLLPWG